MMKAINLTGKLFGRLYVRCRTTNRGREPMWECECSCGNSVVVGGQMLREGRTKSCGCLMKDVVKTIHKTHGGTINGKPSSEYRTWLGIKSRCYNPNNISFHNYGMKGIRVCDRWKYSFQNFFDDMGARPSKSHSIERIDSSKDYSKENCEWANIVTQNNNTSRNVVIEVDGVKLTAAEWGRCVGIRGAIILQRIRRGWRSKDAVFGIKQV